MFSLFVKLLIKVWRIFQSVKGKFSFCIDHTVCQAVMKKNRLSAGKVVLEITEYTNKSCYIFINSTLLRVRQQLVFTGPMIHKAVTTSV